jgi:hypothetical protein
MRSHVRDRRCGFRRKREVAVRDEAIDVVDPEADPFEVKRGDRATQRVR